MNITRIGLDLAKNVLQVHGVDERGKALLRKRLKRGEVVAFFARLSPCLIGMEAAAVRITGRASLRRSATRCD